MSFFDNKFMQKQALRMLKKALDEKGAKALLVIENPSDPGDFDFHFIMQEKVLVDTSNYAAPIADGNDKIIVDKATYEYLELSFKQSQQKNNNNG